MHNMDKVLFPVVYNSIAKMRYLVGTSLERDMNHSCCYKELIWDGDGERK